MNQRGLVVVFLLSLVFVSSFASAEAGVVGDTIRGIVQDITDIFEPIFKPLLGETGSGSSDVFLAKILMLLAYFSFVWAICNEVPFIYDKKWVGFVVSAVVAILGIRYLTPDAILAGAISSSATVLALFIFISFAVFFFVIEKVTIPILRKFAWIILAACYIGLLVTRNVSSDGITKDVAFWIYSAAILLSALAFSLDGTIQSLFNRARVESNIRAGGTVAYEKLLTKHEQIKDAYLQAVSRGDLVRIKKLKIELANSEKALAAAAALS